MSDAESTTIQTMATLLAGLRKSANPGAQAAPESPAEPEGLPQVIPMPQRRGRPPKGAGGTRRPGPYPLSPRLQRVAFEIARVAIKGATNPEIARQLGLSVSTVCRIRKHPQFTSSIEKARTALRTESADAATAGRAEALEAARSVVQRFNEKESGIDATTATKAASLLITASAPPSQSQRETAKRELLKQLSPQLRKAVLQELQAAHAGYVENLSDDELEQLLRA